MNVDIELELKIGREWLQFNSYEFIGVWKAFGCIHYGNQLLISMMCLQLISIPEIIILFVLK
jgi:hypothetical protein